GTDRYHKWDVKRSYNITKDGFDKAVEGIEIARKQGRTWWLNNHCGDFAEGVAKTAGVPLDLPFTFDPRQPGGRDRPAVFGRYLRQHGGVTIEEDRVSSSFFQGVAGVEQIAPEVQDTLAAQEAAEDAIYRAQLEKYRREADERERMIHERVMAQDRIREEHLKFLATWQDRWDYLREMTGLACSNPDALEDQMQSGQLHDVAIEDLDLAYMMDQTETISQKERPVVNSCQKYLLIRILETNGLMSGQDLLTWARRYRKEHPSLLARFTTKTGDMLSSMTRAFGSLVPNPGSGNDDRRGQENPNSRHSPDNWGSLNELRGVAGFH